MFAAALSYTIRSDARTKIYFIFALKLLYNFMNKIISVQ